MTDVQPVKVVITFSTWLIPKQTYSAGPPANLGAVLAVRRFGRALKRLADA